MIVRFGGRVSLMPLSIDNLHVKRLHPLGHILSNVPQADDPQGLARQLVPQEEERRPAVKALGPH